MALADAAGTQRRRHLLAGGARGLERIGYTPAKHKIQPYWPIKHKHWATVPWHTMAVYHLGNNMEFHGDVYDLAIRTPGLLVIHDLALDDFVMGMVATRSRSGTRRCVKVSCSRPGSTGSRRPNATTRSASPTSRTPRGTRGGSSCTRRSPNATCARSAARPDLRRAPPRGRERAARPQGGGRRSRDPRVARVHGDADAGRRVRRPERGQADRRRRRGDGAPAPGRAPGTRRATHPRVRRRAAGARGGLGARVSIHTDVSDEDFLAWMCASDVSVDLRYPHRGEVSGSLARSMQCGRPTVVSATGTYLDLPEDAVVRVPAGRLAP